MTSPLPGACPSHPGASQYRIAGLQGRFARHRTLPPGCLRSFLCKACLCMLPGAFSWCRELNDKPPPGCMPVPSRASQFRIAGLQGRCARHRTLPPGCLRSFLCKACLCMLPRAFSWCRELNDKPPPGCMPDLSRGWSLSDSGAPGLLGMTQNIAARWFEIISVQGMPLHAAWRIQLVQRAE
jgi:hypothetical protein